MGPKKFESKANVVQKIFGPEIFSFKKLESNQILSKKKGLTFYLVQKNWIKKSLNKKDFWVL